MTPDALLGRQRRCLIGSSSQELSFDRFWFAGRDFDRTKLEATTPDIRYEGSDTTAGHRVVNRARISGVVLLAAAINRQEVSELPRSEIQQRQASTGTDRTYATNLAASTDQHNTEYECRMSGCVE
jgi:hypothetical protein